MATLATNAMYVYNVRGITPRETAVPLKPRETHALTGEGPLQPPPAQVIYPIYPIRYHWHLLRSLPHDHYQILLTHAL